MNFITRLPKSHGKEVIFVVVDMLSKYGHFMALAHPFKTVDVAQAYLDGVFRLHGWAKLIISDRDSIFFSTFWQSLFSIQGAEFKLSSAYHPQIDGHTDTVNKCLETNLRCMSFGGVLKNGVGFHLLNGGTILISIPLLS